MGSVCVCGCVGAFLFVLLQLYIIAKPGPVVLKNAIRRNC